MGVPGEQSPDSFESTLAAAHALMRRREGDEACRLLADATERAITGETLDKASLFSSVRGSYLVALGRDDEALDAYLEAERLSGGEVYYQLTTARHMVTGVGQPERALEKVDPLVVAPSDDPGVRQQARAIRGMALLSLGQSEAAIDELEAICAELPPRLPAVSLDLTLVEALVRNDLGVEVCWRYLSLVESKAQEDGETRVLAKVTELQGLLQGPD
jgi:tetratricopeptide (TPR) repeat protein